MNVPTKIIVYSYTK